MKRITLALFLATAILSAFSISCGDSQTETQTQAAAKADSSNDATMKKAAQTDLRNAMMDQEVYFTDNEIYASSITALEAVDDKINPDIQVVKGDALGYEMKLEAKDSDNTVYVVRKSDMGTEMVDESGKSW